MELASSQKSPYKNIDRSQLNKCTMCNFKTHVKSHFQRHLMRTHGIKLKGLEEGTTGHYAALGRVVNNYGISQPNSKKELNEADFSYFVCERCNQKHSTIQKLKFHKNKCFEKFKALRNNQPLHTCEECGNVFLKAKTLSRHRVLCGKAKDIHCQLCPFKSSNLNRMQRHFIDLHNLICRAVEEPDFDQALNKTPYTLERAVELEQLPSLEELDSLPEKELLRPVDQITAKPSTKQHEKCNKMFPCDICGHEFLKERSSMMDIQLKLQEYERFVEDKLKPDLRDIELTLTCKSSSCKEWTDLKNVITSINEFKDKDRDMKVRFSLGNDVSTFAEICDYENAYVDIGLGYILEMNREEAGKYADIRIKLLLKEISHLRKLAVNVKVHIKMVLLAIGELQQTVYQKSK